jgi:hypothetical protein
LPVFRAVAAVIWPYRPGGNRTHLFPVAIDWTKVRAFHVIFAAMPRKKRALPLAFGVYHPNRLRHSQNKLERGLCTLVASLLPKGAVPLFLADAGFGQTEFIRWLQEKGFAFVIRLRPETLIHYRGRTARLGDFDTIEGAPIMLSNVHYRGQNPVTINIVISRLGDSVWHLGTSFTDAEQTVAWYKKRFWRNVPRFQEHFGPAPSLSQRRDTPCSFTARLSGGLSHLVLDRFARPQALATVSLFSFSSQPHLGGSSIS